MAYELSATTWSEAAAGVGRSVVGVGMLVVILMYFLEIDAPGAQQELFVGGVLGNVRRASGLVGNTGPFGHLAATWTCFAFLVGSKDPKFGRWIVCLAAALGPAAILLSSSRGAVVNCVMAVVAYVLTRPFTRRSQRRRWRASSIVIAVVAGAATVFAGLRSLPAEIVDASIDRLNIFSALEGNNTFTDSSGRYESWPAALSQGLRGPFWGVGPKTYELGTSALVDNSFINAFIISGLVGGFCFIGFWLLLVLGGLVAVLRDLCRLRPWRLALGQIAQALTGDIYTYWYSMPFGIRCPRSRVPATACRTDVIRVLQISGRADIGGGPRAVEQLIDWLSALGVTSSVGAVRSNGRTTRDSSAALAAIVCFPSPSDGSQSVTC